MPNVRVKFDLNGDVNSIGGKFTTGSTVLYSDANGVVTTAYVSRHAVEPDRRRDDPGLLRQERHRPKPAQLRQRRELVTLTVTSEPLGVTIGTNELIIVNELTYTEEVRRQRLRLGRRRQARRQRRRLARSARTTARGSTSSPDGLGQERPGS